MNSPAPPLDLVQMEHLVLWSISSSSSENMHVSLVPRSSRSMTRDVSPAQSSILLIMCSLQGTLYIYLIINKWSNKVTM